MESPSLVLLSRQDVLTRQMEIVANNIANASTTGFKRQNMLFETYLSEVQPGDRIEFVAGRASYRDLSPGPIMQTGNPLDVALEGKGYFGVQTPQGTMYTRSGAFRLDAEGQIVTASGYPVLSADGQVVAIPPDAGDIQITEGGTISTSQGQIGQLQPVEFADENMLEEVGNGLLKAHAQPQPSLTTKVVQGAIETSNVSPVLEMTQVIEISRAYIQTARMIDQENDRLRTALRTLGRVTAA